MSDVMADAATELLTRFRASRANDPSADAGEQFRAAADEVLGELKADAERWRALIKSQRIRIIGSARLGEPNGHISLEIWGQYRSSVAVNPDVLALARRSLTDFADGLR